MKRRALGAGLVLAIAVVVPVTSAASGPGAATAADCVPVHHSKKVVKKKKVRRHGKLVTVRKKKTVSWWTCDPAPEPPLPAACSEPSSNLQVNSHDQTGSYYVLSRPCVSSGVVNVELNNEAGMDPHNVFFRRLDSGSTDPVYRLPDTPPFEVDMSEQEEADLNLTAGDWYLWCSLLTHEEQGMHATLAVR